MSGEVLLRKSRFHGQRGEAAAGCHRPAARPNDGPGPGAEAGGELQRSGCGCLRYGVQSDRVLLQEQSRFVLDRYFGNVSS